MTTRRRSPSVDGAEDSDEEYDDEPREVGAQTGTGTQTQGTGGLSDELLKTRGAQLARYALYMEYKRRPLNRKDTANTVVPDYPRALNAVIKSANRQLREVFGMEIVEYRGKVKTDVAGMSGKGKGRQKVGEEEQEEKAKGSATYGLRSTLPIELIRLINEPRDMPGYPIADDEYREDDDVPDSGALLRWEKGDGGSIGHVALLGIRTIILCLILCSGRVVLDDHLHALLKRLNLHRDTVLPYTSSDNKEPPLTLEKYLSELEKAKYLEKRTIPNPNGVEEAATIEWRWGSREVEFSEKAAAQFIEDVFEAGEESSDEEEEVEGSRRRARDREADQEKKKRKLREDIIKSAGGELMGEL